MKPPRRSRANLGFVLNREGLNFIVVSENGVVSFREKHKRKRFRISLIEILDRAIEINEQPLFNQPKKPCQT